jgi:hypothetical protein
MDVRQVIPRDAIPSVENPSFGTAYPGEGEDLVVAVGGDPPRAYPLRYLDFHEVVNDSLGGDPIAVTWCPLCGSAAVYGRRHGGRVLEFGVSGKLADDDLVMYDRETESEWKQSSGECIAGEFEGDTLSVRPAATMPWRAFRGSHPEGVVLQRPGEESEAAGDGDDPDDIDYGESPYDEYFEREGFGYDAYYGESTREWDREDLGPKTVVLGVEEGDAALGFPLPRVRGASGVVQTAVGDRDAVVFATETAGIHGYADPGYEFERDGEAFVADGTRWDSATGRAADGRRLERLATRRLFAFAWQDDHGPGAFYSP